MKRSWVAALLVLVPAAALSADEQLNVFDLKAAYCAAATTQLRDYEAKDSTAAAGLNKGIDHFDRYLSARGFAARTDLPLLTNAQGQGKADGQEAHRIAQACIPQCPDATAEQKKQLIACMSACERHFDTHGITPRLSSCTAIEQQLPF